MGWKVTGKTTGINEQGQGMNKPHEERVLAEKKDLDEKRGKLSYFMHSDTFASLSAINQGLLMVQLAAMDGYSEALSRRIELFD